MRTASESLHRQHRTVAAGTVLAGRTAAGRTGAVAVGHTVVGHTVAAHMPLVHIVAAARKAAAVHAVAAARTVVDHTAAVDHTEAAVHMVAAARLAAALAVSVPAMPRIVTQQAPTWPPPPLLQALPRAVPDGLCQSHVIRDISSWRPASKGPYKLTPIFLISVGLSTKC